MIRHLTKTRALTPELCIMLMAVAMPLSHATWMALVNNFVVERAAFQGPDIGMLQSVREIPGFLAFAVIFLLPFIREQSLAFLSLVALGIGVAVTGLFPTYLSLMITTLLMSTGFHAYETMQMSLTLQWMSKEEAPTVIGRQLAVGSFAALVAYGLIWLILNGLGLDYVWIYVAGGGLTVVIALIAWKLFPAFEGAHVQHKKMILRKRYWLYYALQFMGGARRQIFIVFAGFLLVSKFGYSAAEITALFLVNHVLTMGIAPKLGGYVSRFGERSVLIFEYVGLIAVFIGYALVESSAIAAGLYLLDHLFFSFAIAQKTYFQKIADPRDIAATSSVSFSINHVAAVFIPALFGAFLWPISPALVFYAGAAMAAISLILSLNVPARPAPGNEVVRGKAATSDIRQN